MRLVFAAVALLAPTAAAQPVADGQPAAAQPEPVARHVDPEALAVLERAVEAWRGVESWTSTLELNGTGIIGSSMPEISARLSLLRDGDDWFVRGVGTLSEGDDQTPLDIAWRPGSAQWVDHEKRQIISGKLPRTKASMVRRYLDEWLLNPGALESRLDAERIELLDDAGGEGGDGRTLLIVKDEQKEKWRVGADDFLPRRIESVTPVGSIVYTFGEVRTDEGLKPGQFAVDAPDGYERVETAEHPKRAKRSGNDPLKVQPIAPRNDSARARAEKRPDAAPGFELKTPDGKPVALADLRGGMVVLDFWGTWCMPCKKAGPEVQKLHDDYAGRGVKVLGLAVREKKADAPAKYMEEHGYTYTILLDADEVAREYGVKSYPTLVVIGYDGAILHTEIGYDEETTFRNIRKVLDRELEKTKASPADEG